MKYLLTISLLVATYALWQCTPQKSSAYDIPDHVPPENKALFIERAEKGKALYKIHCGGCHGIFTKGKDGVPNFTSIQIDNYHATALIGLDPKNHAVAKKMSSEQIDYVITFLRIRKVK
ncbi:MAG: cytochrome c [Chitinophagaceae bacterium]|nr:cytochrome c [Chitinophagaceae bacterium]